MPLDAVDMKVRQIFLDAFARARRPRLTVDPCERCEGEGVVVYRFRDGYAIEPYERVCLRCNGTGVESS